MRSGSTTSGPRRISGTRFSRCQTRGIGKKGEFDSVARSFAARRKVHPDHGRGSATTRCGVLDNLGSKYFDRDRQGRAEPESGAVRPPQQHRGRMCCRRSRSRCKTRRRRAGRSSRCTRRMLPATRMFISSDASWRTRSHCRAWAPREAFSGLRDDKAVLLHVYISRTFRRTIFPVRHRVAQEFAVPYAGHSRLQSRTTTRARKSS